MRFMTVASKRNTKEITKSSEGWSYGFCIVSMQSILKTLKSRSESSKNLSTDCFLQLESMKKELRVIVLKNWNGEPCYSLVINSPSMRGK